MAALFALIILLENTAKRSKGAVLHLSPGFDVSFDVSYGFILNESNDDVHELTDSLRQWSCSFNVTVELFLNT